MGSLNFVDTFVTFLTLLGPQKILLSFDEASHRLGPDLACVLTLGPVMRRLHPSIREVLSRLLGLLLAGVGAELFLQGLTGLGVLTHQSGGGH